MKAKHINMYAEERQEAILLHARAAGRVDVATLAVEFGITTETVRRDLTVLERRGLLRRVHGGAIPVERLTAEPALAVRSEAFVAEKVRIAAAALAELPEDGAILLDAGSTTARLADALPADRELTVVTNALPIAAALAASPNLTVLMLGGRIRGRTLAGVDGWPLAALRETFVEVAFMAANGVSIERGLTTPDPSEAAVKKAMIAAARRTVLLVDHSKFSTDYLARFGSVADVDTVITDTGIERVLVDELAAEGTRVVLA